MRILVLFNLKPGIDEARYESWAKEHDLPGVNSLPSVDAFRIWKSTGLMMGEGTPPYRYFEVIDIGDMEGFGKDAASDAVRALAEEFATLADAIFITTEEVG